jgi:hypothetical protein
MQIPPRLAGRQLLFFIASRTGMLVKRAAVGAEGFVLDHYDREALDRYLRVVGDRLLTAFGPRPPFAIFCDSLEAYEGDWTGDLLVEFQRRRGYDLAEHLPALVAGDTAESADVRHDWGRTLSELVNERFFAPLADWAHRAGTRLRAQAYGIPPATLSSNALVDVSEGEGAQWTRLTATRWASSAAHVYGRQIASSETWTWLHSPAFRATPLDLKAEADRHFLQGINQLVGHGWPYSPAAAEYPGWRFYAAGAFNDSNPWWIVMPDVARYLQRVSFMLRQGAPVADVAVYLPTSDAWARFTPGHVNLFVGPDLLGTLTGAGFAFDLFDDEALARLGRVEGSRLAIGPGTYRAVILPAVERMPVPTLRTLDAFAGAGGVVIATRRIPSRAPGLRATPSEQADLRETAARLFQQPAAPGRLVTDEGDGLLAALPALLRQDVRLTPAVAAVGFVHRRLPYADVYFLANTSNVEVRTEAVLRTPRRTAELWDPMTGEVLTAPGQVPGQDRITIPVALEPYASRMLVVTDRAPAAPHRPANLLPPPVPVHEGWLVRFPGDPVPHPVTPLRSWTEAEGRRYFSGVATYEVDVLVPDTLVRAGVGVRLDLGEARPVPEHAVTHGMRAWLDPPVREAAIVWVNDMRVGPVWCPPYAVDVTRALRRGANRIRIDVANLAINAMAGRALPSHRLLHARYGTRFEPQDMDKVQPVPAGLLGEVRLVPFAR